MTVVGSSCHEKSNENSDMKLVMKTVTWNWLRKWWHENGNENTNTELVTKTMTGYENGDTKTLTQKRWLGYENDDRLRKWWHENGNENTNTELVTKTMTQKPRHRFGLMCFISEIGLPMLIIWESQKVKVQIEHSRFHLGYNSIYTTSGISDYYFIFYL